MIAFPANRWTELADELGVKFAERCDKYDETDGFVAENYAELKAKKVLAAGVPTELGGGGATVAELCDLLRTLAHHCSSTALALSMHTHLVATTTWRLRNQNAPVDGLLRRVAAEDLVLVSTGGADWLLGSGKAVKVDGGYRVTARKIFCSGAPAGSMLMTTAVVDEPGNGPTVMHLAVPMSADGVKVQDNWHTIGMRGTGSHDITLEDVFVPDSAVAVKRPSGKWHPAVHAVTMIALPLITSVYVGVAEAAREIAVASAKKRRDDRAAQVLAGELDTELSTAQVALARLIDLAMHASPGEQTTLEVLTCRTILGRAARSSVDKAMELAGGSSFFRSAKLERLFRDVQGVRFHPMQEKPQAVLAGRVALGLPFDE